VQFFGVTQEELVTHIEKEVPRQVVVVRSRSPVEGPKEKGF
jgi:hypothetical protein